MCTYVHPIGFILTSQIKRRFDPTYREPIRADSRQFAICIEINIRI